MTRRRLHPRTVLCGALVVAALAAGCGPRPPQAPQGEASRIDSALSTMSSACGDAEEIQAYGRTNRRALVKADAQAASAVPGLAAVLRRNPAWIYQNLTVAQIVTQARSLLDGCGLHGAARRLHAAASRASS